MEQLLERAYETLREQARARGRSTTSCELHARPVIVSDGDRVLQIVGNLLSNAFQGDARRRPDLGSSSPSTNGTVHVGVEDTGPGIAEAERERLFRPVLLADGSGGTGLGLAIARELSTRSAAGSTSTPSVGRGSRFELILPA